MADHNMDLHDQVHDEEQHEDDNAMLDPDEADETIEQDDDAAMDSGEDDDNDDEDMMQHEIQLQNDSQAHFDLHSDSLFCIAQHPTNPAIVATGGGDDRAFIWDSTPLPGPVLPRSYETEPAAAPVERESLQALAVLDGQDESVNAIAFTLPGGEYVVTGTLAGTLSAYKTPISQTNKVVSVGTAKEVEEINWIQPCPSAAHPNTIALGASDGSVWVYEVSSAGLTIIQTFFLHQAPCTAGAWTPDGKLLATVSEDSSFYVWDAFGDAAVAGIKDASGGQAVVGLTGVDERFRVDGGLYSVAISPGGGIAAVGGAGGHIRIIGLPRLGAASAASTGKGGQGARAKAGGAKQAAQPSAANVGQAGQILAALQAQSDGVETLDFSQPPLTLLAAGSVDGSIALFDAAHNFAIRRSIPEAHADEDAAQAVIQVQFVKTPLGTANPNGHVLTSAGNDGVVRRWDVRGGTAATNKGFMGEWKGHRGGGEGGGILGFAQGGGGKRIVTAGDDGVALVFDM